MINPEFHKANWSGPRTKEKKAARYAAVISEYEAGRSAIEIAGEMGLSKQRIYQMLARARRRRMWDERRRAGEGGVARG